MDDVLVNLVSSALTGVAVWLGQRLLRLRAAHRLRRFLGVGPGDACLMVVPRHFSSPEAHSVHRNDLAAVVEASVLVREAGGRPRLVAHDSPIGELGRHPEFCIGGPDANARTASHLRRFLPGVAVVVTDAGAGITLHVGDRAYPWQPGVRDHGLLARLHLPGPGRPVFLSCGQTAAMNAAIAAYLAANHRRLTRRFGAAEPFCLLLALNDPAAYGTDLVELVDDVTAPALAPRPEPAAG